MDTDSGPSCVAPVFSSGQFQSFGIVSPIPKRLREWVSLRYSKWLCDTVVLEGGAQADPQSLERRCSMTRSGP